MKWHIYMLYSESASLTSTFVECRENQHVEDLGYVTIPTPPSHPAYKGMCVCVQLGMYASPRYVTIPTPPTHPPNPKVCVCVCVRTVGNVCKSKVCYHPQPTHPPYKGMCVCAYSWECMQVQGMLPSPAHPPTQPKGMCGECMQVQGMLLFPAHPPTHHPPNPKVCVYRWVPKNTLCVQMSQICVRRWGFWSVYRWVKSVCADESPTPGMYKKPCEQWINYLLTGAGFLASTVS